MRQMFAINESSYIEMFESVNEILTIKEIEIIKLIGVGKTRKELCSILNISIGTVSTHQENIKRKLNIKTRGSLQAFSSFYICWLYSLFL